MRRREFVASSLGLAAEGAVEKLAGGVRGPRALALQTDRAAPLGKWIHLSPFPEAHEEVGGAAAGGKLYVIGGAAQLPPYGNLPIRQIQPHRSLDTVEEYDPSTSTWRPRAPMPTARNHMGAGTVSGKIYVIGGRLTGAFSIAMPGNTGVVQEYDPAANSWATRAPMPPGRTGR